MSKLSAILEKLDTLLSSANEKGKAVPEPTPTSPPNIDTATSDPLLDKLSSKIESEVNPVKAHRYLKLYESRLRQLKAKFSSANLFDNSMEG